MRGAFSSRFSRGILTAIFLLTLFAVAAFGSYRLWIHGADHRDFYPRWAGARFFLEGEKDLYSIEATGRIQLRLYGEYLPADRDQQGFAYPAYALPILLPFALISDVEIATAVWDGVSLVLIVVSLYLLQKAARGSPNLLPVSLLVIWSYTLLMLFQGQITGLIMASLAIGYWLYREDRSFLGGLVLSFGSIKPELVLLPVLVLAIKSLLRRDIKLIAGVFAGFMMLFLASLAMLGWWVDDWVAALFYYLQYAQTAWAFGTLSGFSPLLGLGVIAFGAFFAYRYWRYEETIFSGSVAFQLMLFPQTLIWGLSMLCLPLIFTWTRGSRLGFLAVWLLGWVAFFALSTAELWVAQLVLLPVAVLVLIVYVYRHEARRNAIEG